MINILKGKTFFNIDVCSVDFERTSHLDERDQRVVKYLRSNTLHGMCAGWLTDKYTGQLVPGWRPNVRCDDAYAWGEEIAYYMSKYNAELPPVFLEHIYSRI